MFAASPLFWNVVPAVDAINTPFRYTRYPATPTLSVDPAHDRLICDEDTTVAAGLPGVLGGVVSTGAVTVRLNDAVRTSEPAVPVTVTADTASGVEAVV